MRSRDKYKIIVFGGSAGSFSVIRKILTSLPGEYLIPLVMCFHRLRDKKNGFVESLETGTSIRLLEPLDKSKILPRHAYLAPANYHLLVEASKTFALSTEEEINFSRPSLDLTFETAALAYRETMVGILLSGANTDGATGMFMAHKLGAITIVQDPVEAAFSIMPQGALNLFEPDHIYNVGAIIEFLTSIGEH